VPDNPIFAPRRDLPGSCVGQDVYQLREGGAALNRMVPCFPSYEWLPFRQAAAKRAKAES